MQIEIKNLHCKALIGCRDWEKKQLQDLWITVNYELSSKDYQSDEIENTTSYSDVAQLITSHVEEGHTALIETLAYKIASLLRDVFNLTNVLVKVRKKAIENAEYVEAIYKSDKSEL